MGHRELHLSIRCIERNMRPILRTVRGEEYSCCFNTFLHTWGLVLLHAKQALLLFLSYSGEPQAGYA